MHHLECVKDFASPQRQKVAKIVQCGEPFMFWVYVLQNPQGKFYIGQTEDLPARIEFKRMKSANWIRKYLLARTALAVNPDELGL